MKNKGGFTLIELMITVVVIAILAVIAVYMYFDNIRTSRRSDAINTIASISMAEERYRTTNSQYGTLAQVWNGVTTSPGGYYTLSISNLGATTYTITATAIGNQANDTESGVSCSSMVMAVSSGTVSNTPTTCWPQ